MTIIATDGISIACDGLKLLESGIVVASDTRKVVTLGGTIYGFTGNVPMWQPLIEWHGAGAVPDHFPKCAADDDWTLIVIGPDRRVMQYTEKHRHPEEMPKAWAWGVSRDVALGAMWAGRTAEEALRIAVANNVWLGGEIQVVDIATALGEHLQSAAE